MPLPQSNQGLLLVIGAGFILIGMLGGGFELSAIKIPSIAKWPRIFLSGLGILSFLAGLLLMFVPAATPAAAIAGSTLNRNDGGPAAVVPQATTPAPPTPTTPLSPPAGTLSPSNTPVAPTSFLEQAYIEDVSLEQNATQYQQQGLRVHVKFTIDALKGVPCKVVAYFLNADGTPAKSNDGAYGTVDKQAATFRDFTPIQDSTRFDDYTLFMPYSVFENLAPGKYAMKIQVEIFDQRNFNRSLATSDYIGFDFTRGSNN